jgi:uncharacterized phage-associated protein
MASDENVPAVGMVPAVRSSLEVALWFYDRAESANRALDNLTLQQFLYLAQIEYAKAHNGRKLMPATFLATNTGPLEPTVYHIFERGRPNVRDEPPSFTVSNFLMDVWNKYAPLSSRELTGLANDDMHYRHAFDQGRNHEISVTALRIVPDEPEPLAETMTEPETEEQPATPADDGELVSYSPSGKPATRWTPGGTRNPSPAGDDRES